MKPKFLANKIITLISLLILLTINNTAMAFTNVNGKADSLDTYLGKGKFTVVEVWATDCPVCKKHMPDMVKFDGKLKNTQIVGVSIDGQMKEDDVDDFIMQFGMKFPNLISNAVEMNIWMQKNTPEGLIGTPSFMIFNPKGKLLAMQAGPVKVDQIERLIREKSQLTATPKKKG